MGGWLVQGGVDRDRAGEKGVPGEARARAGRDGAGWVSADASAPRRTDNCSDNDYELAPVVGTGRDRQVQDVGGGAGGWGSGRV